VPIPAAGKTALRTFMEDILFQNSWLNSVSS
jgi:hypothetical protein